MNLLNRLLTAALATVLLFSCSNSNEKKCAKPEKVLVTNPNRDSELALAMREIFNQTEDIKVSLERGILTIPENYIENLKKFHTLIPTDPEVKVEQFYGFINAIDQAASSLKIESDIEAQKKGYTRVVNACIQCHQNFCPGPIQRINKLKL